MSENYKPILFSGAMIGAILDGSKTQTRRVMRYAPLGSNATVEQAGNGWQNFYGEKPNRVVEWTNHKCPFGKIGDKLWVRETWAEFAGIEPKIEYVYRADGIFDTPAKEHLSGNKWRPSIYMPRAASRIALEITDVRVERLQSISEDDAKAEGVKPLFTAEEIQSEKFGYRAELDLKPTPFTNYLWETKADNGSQSSSCKTAKGSFQSLWTLINGKREGCRWSDNPFVWCLSFRII